MNILEKSNGESLVNISKTKTIALWSIIVLTAAAFGSAGIGKIIGAVDVTPMLTEMGLPSWVHYLIGPAELAGAVGLLIRKLSAAAAIGLTVIMVGAIYGHVLFTPLVQALPAIMLLVFCGIIFMFRRKDIPRDMFVDSVAR